MSESSDSESSEAFNSLDDKDYITTNLLYKRNLTVADIFIEEVSRTDIVNLEGNLMDGLSIF